MEQHQVHRERGWTLFLFAAYTFITVLLTYPLAFSLTTRVSSIIGDAIFFLWDLYWFKHALLDLHTDPLHTNQLFAPQTQVPLVWSSPLNELAGIPLQMLFGLLAAYNLLILMTFVLSGWTTYLLCRYFTANRWAAFVGGIVFSFSAYHLAQGTGHLGLVTTQWIPLYALALFRLVDQPTPRCGLQAGGAFALVALSEPYYLISFLLPFTLAFAVYLAITSLSPARRERFVPFFSRLSGWRAAGCALLLALILCLPFYLPYVTLSAQTGGTKGPFDGGILRWSANLLAYVLPAPPYPLVGKVWPSWLPVQRLESAEEVIYLGWVSLVLVTWKLVRRPTAIAIFWVGFAGFALLLSLGPVLQVGQYSSLTLPLPYAVITRLPLLSAYRAPARLAVSVQLGLAVLVSLAIQDLLERIARCEGRLIIQNKDSGHTASSPLWGKDVAVRCAALFISAVILLETWLAVPYPTISLPVPRFYTRLAAEPGNFAILELPDQGIAKRASLARYQYYQITHGKRLVDGELTRTPPGLLHFMNQTNYIYRLTNPDLRLPASHQSSDSTIAYTLDLGQSALPANTIRYVVLHPGDFPGSPLTAYDYQLFRHFLSRTLGAPIYTDADTTVYSTTPAPLAPFVPLNLLFDGKIRLLGYRLSPGPYRVTSTVRLTLFWQPLVRLPDYTVFMHLTGTGDRPIAQDDHPPQQGDYPTSQWRPGETIEDAYDLPLTGTGGGGSYTLQFGFYVPGAGQRLRISERQGHDTDQVRVSFHT